MRTAFWIAFFNIASNLGCTSPRDRLTFPRAPVEAHAYDTRGDGRVNFTLLLDERGRVNRLAYDDDADGTADRIYRLSDYDNARVPHVIILLDSIPYQAVADRYAAGHFRFFDPPQKLIPPFPSLSEQIFSQILQAPPLPGMIDGYYDARSNQVSSGVMSRVKGYHQPWEYRCNYVAKYYEAGLSYVQPREWFRTELNRAKAAIDRSPDRVTVVYLVSTSGMLCKLGRAGLDTVLDEIERFCLQLLYERQGAVKISMLADHGHNLVTSTNITLVEDLKRAGFDVVQKRRRERDVVLDLDGLVTYLGIHTSHPAEVARVIVKRPEIELAMYMQQDRVIVRDGAGSAAVECRGGRLRYVPIDHDVLGYRPVIESLTSGGKMDIDGFASDEDWLAATVDHPFPDAPRRVWDAFHGQTINPPDVMLTIRDGFCCGHASLQTFIKMASTHGGLNQGNSATFLMTMTGRAAKPLRSRDVMATIEPGYLLPVRTK
jgi:hypothetical protein